MLIRIQTVSSSAKGATCEIQLPRLRMAASLLIAMIRVDS